MKKCRFVLSLVVSICILVACSQVTTSISGPASTASAVPSPSMPSVTPNPSPTATRTLVPSTTPTPTLLPTATYLPITPVAQETSLPEYGAAISIGNLDRLTLLARWGQGNPGEVVYTPDGKYLIVGAATGLYFYDPGTFLLLHVIKTPAAVFHLAVSPDSQTLAAVIINQVLLYRLSDFQRIKTIEAYADSIDFSPDGKLLALGRMPGFGIDLHPGYLQLRDAVSGEIQTNFKNDPFVASVKFSPRRDFIATGGASTSIWNLDGTLTDDLSSSTDDNGKFITSVSFSPDGNLLAEGSNWGIRIWQVLENKHLNIYRDIDFSPRNDSTTTNVSISPNGKLVAAAWYKGVYVWDLATGDYIFKVPVSGKHYVGLAWSMDNKTVIAASIDEGVQVWSVRTGEILATLTSNTGTFSALAWSPDGNKLAAGAQEGSVYLFKSQDGTILQHFGSGPYLNSLALSPDGQNLAVGDFYKKIQIWNVNGSLLRTLGGVGYGHSNGIFTMDGSEFAAIARPSWADPEEVRYWNTRDWQVEKDFPLDNDLHQINGFALAPDQRFLAISDSSNSGNVAVLHIISIEDGTQFTIQRSFSYLEAIAFSPNGTMLAECSHSILDSIARIRVWQTSDWKLVYDETIPNKSLLPFSSRSYLRNLTAWSPDSQFLALGMADGSIQFLDARTGKLLPIILPGHALQVTGVAFSPDGRLLASISIDGTVMLWGIR
jgi:WD40 repeat protein